MEKLAIYGGTPLIQTGLGTGKRFGDEELAQLTEALQQQTLFYWSGTKVKAFCEKMAKLYGVKYCVATSSGTAAIHTALGALGITEGDEVIVPPITDMGTVIGVLYQNAIPIFADLDPHTYNLDPKSVEEKNIGQDKGDHNGASCGQSCRHGRYFGYCKAPQYLCNRRLRPKLGFIL